MQYITFEDAQEMEDDTELFTGFIWVWKREVVSSMGG